MDDVKIKNLLNLNEFDEIRTVENIKNYFKIGERFPEFCKNSHPKHSEMRRATQMALFTHPIPIQNRHQVSIIKIVEPNKMNINTLVKYWSNIRELKWREYCDLSEVVIIDLVNVQSEHINSITSETIKQIYKFCTEVYSMRLKKIYFINYSRCEWEIQEMLFNNPLIRGNGEKIDQELRDVDSIMAEICTDETLQELYYGENGIEEMNRDLYNRLRDMSLFTQLEKIRHISFVKRWIRKFRGEHNATNESGTKSYNSGSLI
ncbi:hypothetical protein GEV33_002551 [Tenebrio molitor]|uniref:CRAL-TRIO domain-containing protein n=1 Tax=Tenebrio molitor TaxID=7067 RepID=A0A8J6HK59_TENMO|nr:hypothetical protein GEV33_002551 [Tenebrio molitor]